MTTYGLLIYEEAEALDFVGPWQIFASSAASRSDQNAVRTPW